MDDAISLQHLKAFLAVARHRNFGQAARTMNVSQPAITLRIKDLEDVLGYRLFDRTTRHVELTHQGSQLLPQIERLMDDVNSTISNMRAYSNLERGRVVIACLPSIAVGILGPVMSRFHDLYPSISILIRDGHVNGVIESVRSRESDFGITQLGQDDTEITFSPMFADRFRLICPANHPLAQGSDISLSEVAAYPFVAMSTQTGIREIVDREMTKRDLTLNVVCEISQLGTLEGLVSAGLGVSLIPDLATYIVRREEIAIKDLRDCNLTRNVGVITRQGRTLSPAAKRVLHLLQEFSDQPRNSAGF